MSNADRETAALATLAETPARDALVKPAADAAAILANQRAYHQLVADLLDDSDYQQIDGRRFKKKSAWRKLNVAFNVNMEILSQEVTRDGKGNIVRATVTARAEAPNGRICDGIGVCDKNERKFAHAEHDILATAHTRAANRAAADLYGMGEVSAEEVDASTGELPPKPKPQPITDLDRAVLAEWYANLAPPLQHRVDRAAQQNRIPEGGPTTVAGRDRVAWIILSNIPERRRPEPSAEAWVQPAEAEPDMETDNEPRYDPDDPARPFTDG